MSITSRIETASLTGLHWIAVVLAVLTGVIHLFLGVNFAPELLGIAFLLAGLGFLGAVVLLLMNYRRKLLYAIGIPYTAIQIVLWYYLNFVVGPKAFPGEIGTIGTVDKIAQVILIVVLIVLYQRAS